MPWQLGVHCGRVASRYGTDYAKKRHFCAKLFGVGLSGQFLLHAARTPGVYIRYILATYRRHPRSESRDRPGPTWRPSRAAPVSTRQPDAARGATQHGSRRPRTRAIAPGGRCPPGRWSWAAWNLRAGTWASRKRRQVGQTISRARPADWGWRGSEGSASSMAQGGHAPVRSYWKAVVHQ